MNVKELFGERHNGVAFDRPRNILIQVSRPAPPARIARSVLGLALSALVGLFAASFLEGPWIVAGLFVGVGIICILMLYVPMGRTNYTSWTYPDSYNMLEDEMIRDRFATHRDDFTRLDD